MTHSEALAELVECQQNEDEENAHLLADEILCKLLAHLGYADVVAEWEKVTKWYA
jgi:hypothetical protein